jgi:protein-S-isoprenylcysteine O-methyltransferase Ste14
MPHGQLLALVCAVWVASELALGAVKRAGKDTSRDRGSLLLLWGSITFATIAAAYARSYAPTRMGNPGAAFWTGLAFILAGIVVRGVATATLWRFFTVDVAIAERHDLIEHGLYAFVRHPAYSGSILSFVGLGVAFGNWLSVGIVALVIVIAFSYRIAVEERALIAFFGDRYRDYMRRTKRLIPGIY